MKPPKTEELAEAYKQAGLEEKRLASKLMKSGHPEEAKILLEILHHFPGTTLVKSTTTDTSQDARLS